jgi:SnoaL-like domain
MTTSEIEELRESVRRLEDESAVTRLILSYGPAADGRLASFAGSLWLEDGVYDWDADGSPHEGSAGVEAMLQADQHRGLVEEGVAHFSGPPLIDLAGDRATVLTYSSIMRREGDRHYLWRVSAVCWNVERAEGRWRVRRRTNRLLDASSAGHLLFREAMQKLFDGASR